LRFLFQKENLKKSASLQKQNFHTIPYSQERRKHCYYQVLFPKNIMMKMIIKWFGHASFLITTLGKKIYIDPYAGEYSEKIDILADQIQRE